MKTKISLESFSHLSFAVFPAEANIAGRNFPPTFNLKSRLMLERVKHIRASRDSCCIVGFAEKAGRPPTISWITREVVVGGSVRRA